jgi:tRNA (guanine37-N1)-methyltransferase
MVNDDEIIVNMFAGVGTYSVVIARTNRTCRVYSIDSNLAASELDAVNAKLNKVQDRIVTIHGDAAKVIEGRLAATADRVLMPLPEKAKEFVDSAVLAIRERGTIHYFAHVKADGKKACQDLGLKDAQEAFAKYRHKVTGVRVVREVGPRIYQIVADVSVSR